MPLFLKIIASCSRTLTKLLLLVVAAGVALVLVCLALVGLLFVVIKALLTGRKPVLVSSLLRFRQASQQFNHGTWHPRQSTGDNSNATGDVIEGQAIEIRDDLKLPRPPEVTKHP
jgi:hypothetical protein